MEGLGLVTGVQDLLRVSGHYIHVTEPKDLIQLVTYN